MFRKERSPRPPCQGGSGRALSKWRCKLGASIVPVVFLNLLDAFAKNARIVRPATIEARVRPSIDTTDWTPESLSHEIAAILGRDLEILGRTNTTVEIDRSADPHHSIVSIKRPLRSSTPRGCTQRPMPGVAPSKSSLDVVSIERWLLDVSSENRF